MNDQLPDFEASQRDEIEILLATFNGARFLPQLLESILAQSDHRWRLLVRDDRSTDDTCEIVKSWAAAHPGRIQFLDEGSMGLGVVGNFAYLMERSTAKLIAFCDQDDFWHAEKLAMSRERIEELQSQFGEHTPLLVHTDLEVVDSQLRTISSSMWNYQKLDPNASEDPVKLAIQNGITGCTMLVNRALILRSLPLPGGVAMHDWWLALVASSFGRIGEIRRPLVKYRQHEGNAVGARPWGLDMRGIRRSRRVLFLESLRVSSLQAEVFVDRFGKNIPKSQLDRYLAWSRVPRVGWASKRYLIVKHRLFRTGVARTISLIVRV